MRPTEKLVVYLSIMIVMTLMAISEETRTGGTPAQWAIFWTIMSLLAFGLLRNLAKPDTPVRRTKRHHYRVTRRDIKEYRRGR